MAIDFGLAKTVGGNDYLAPLQALALGRQAKTEEMKAVREQRMLVSRDQALQQYAQGDKIGARQTATASGDFDLLNHLQSSEDAHRKALGDAYSRIGQAALSLKSVPLAQRPQAFAQMAPALQQLGVPQEVLGSVDFSDASLDGYVAQAQSVGDQIKRFDERNKPVTLSENAKLVTPGGETLATNEGPDKIISLGNGQFVVQGREGSTVGGAPGGGGGGSLGERNGNPGNIRDGSFARAQPGYIGPGEGGFARFEPGAGEKAQERLLSTRYLSRGFNTVDKIIERYAPASENSAASRANYKSYVASKLGISIGDTITLDKLPQLAQAMREFETGNTRGGGTAGPRVMGTPRPDKQEATDRRNLQRDTVGLRKEFDALPEVKNFKLLRGAMRQVESLASKPNPTASDDIGLIFSFMRMLDPTSVVREGEFATAQNAASVPDRIRNMYNNALSGNRLNASQRKDMISTARRTYLPARDVYNETATKFRGYASDLGAEPGKVAYLAVPEQAKAAEMPQFRVVGRRQVK